MKDFLGNELEVGDEVVFMQINYRNLMKGLVVKKGTHKVTIRHEESNTCSVTSIQFGNQVLKVFKDYELPYVMSSSSDASL